ncbi:MAG: PDZ domain-containing protein [Bacteroidota bacterium]|nr:PDZ domain-containing protein [Bacteroidota bacterium]
MKRIFLSTAIFTGCFLFTNTGFSQTENNNDNSQKKEEIIIQKNGNEKGKTIIEIDSNSVTVNGKPLADYNGDVKILTRKYMNGNPDNFLFSPEMNFKINRMHGTRTFLGVLTEKSDKGALIKSVTKGSSAEKGGLKEQDIITKVGDKTITTPEDLAETIRSYKPGDDVNISLLRDGKKKNLEVTLGKTNDNPMAFNYNMDQQNQELRNFKMPELHGLNNMPNPYFKFYNKNQPKLGLRIQDTKDDSGAKILNVEEGSAAEKAGFKKNDIITEINGAKVNNVNDVRDQIMSSVNKEHYSIKAKRNNTDMDFEVQIPKKLNSANL